MIPFTRTVIASLCFVLLQTALAHASAPWADSQLPVQQGLQVWLDAQAQQKAREQQLRPSLADQNLLDVVYDSSGQDHHFFQTSQAAQPRYRVNGNHAWMEFDGQDDVLGRIQHTSQPQDGSQCEEFSLLMLAAPRSNLGGYRAFFSAGALGRNDYTSGLNIDQSALGSPRFEMLNVEGIGFGGARDLLTEAYPFGQFHLIEVIGNTHEVIVAVDGTITGRRPRELHPLSLDVQVLGARYYSNTVQPPNVQSFFDGAISEFLFYDRALADEERTSLRDYLDARHSGLKEVHLEASRHGPALVSVENPPPVQMFTPGFTVRQLPVQLTNVNNVQYREDGKLVALAYDGKVYLLSDRDGDGLEEHVETFWSNDADDPLRSPIGMALTPHGYHIGEGLFVAAKGKCALIVDTDGDDRADRQIVVATGWTELPVNVDALGVAIDPQTQSVFVGLGTENFSNAYLLDRGESHYDLGSERGTILRISPDFQHREIFATGIRFPVAIRFNQHGDLFCTDQEGATWLANGNPFDELLHVQQGLHYGFPPRHPKYLPDVIDEPSVFNYRPQHQSTCGLNFNLPVNQGPVFGPPEWEGDALVAGYSRGKLYRTELVKTDVGYVARNHLLGCADRLVADLCVSPSGGMIVATHSGQPDWGDGPAGQGTLYLVDYAHPELPQPTAVWPQSPREVRVSFREPVDPALVQDLLDGAKIEYGPAVAAGDRFESLRPGYQVVQNQLLSDRHPLEIQSVQLTSDRRTLILSTAPHPQRVTYALTLPGLGRAESPDADGKTMNAGEPLRQFPETDLQYDLTGVDAEWKAADGNSSWTGWLPHWETQVAKQFTERSAEHEEFWKLSAARGQLTLNTVCDLTDMLRPAVQPGSSIDYTWPKEQVTLEFRSRLPFRVRGGDQEINAIKQSRNATSSESMEEFVVKVTISETGRIPFRIAMETDANGHDLRVSWHTAEDERARVFPLTRLQLPWAPDAQSPLREVDIADLPELKGGNWGRGRAVFFSEEALCSKCHQVRGEGGQIGPNLSNLPHRDYASVLRDITRPSFALNPDFLSQTIALQDGRVLTGVVRTAGDNLMVGDQQGQLTTISRDDIDQMVPAKISVMPEKLLEKLGPEKTRDLLTFLLTPPPSMPDYGPLDPPPARSLEEVQAVLEGGEPLPTPLPELSIVLVSGAKDHGPGEHDYPAWQTVWQKLLQMDPATHVETADEWPRPEQFQQADVLVFYQHGTWNSERAAQIDDFLERGGGLVYIHFAVDGGEESPAFAQRIGLASQGGQSAFRHGELDLGFDPAQGHPIARNFEHLRMHDESYWNLAGDKDRINLLATGVEDGQPRPLFWTLQPSHGRVFVSIPGHFAWSFDDPLFRTLLLRGIAWSAGESVDRLNLLVLPGARVETEVAH